MNPDYECHECHNQVLYKIDHKVGCSYGKPVPERGASN